jgi:hypothetical protein
MKYYHAILKILKGGIFLKIYIKRILLGLLILLMIITGIFFIYVSDYSHATDIAVSALNNDSTIKVVGNFTILSPTEPTDTALIFYPGGKVEYSAYVPLLEKLSANGIVCVLVKMPFNLAVFNPTAADNIFALLPQIKNWYIGGHSLGGAMASNYASKHKNKLKGLILLGAYIYGDYSPLNSLTLYGSNDGVLDKSKITYTNNVVVINGGNHAGFGNYGLQHGDLAATISVDEQQRLATQEILKFISGHSN